MRHSDGCDSRRAEAFGTVLARSREARGHKHQEVEVFASSDPLHRPSTQEPDQTWLPHLFCWETAGNVALAWELSTRAELPDLVGARPEDVARWSQRPDLLIELGQLASAVKTPSEKNGEYLSFRWLMANQETAALALSAQSIAIEHVSLHVDVNQEDAVVRVLTVALGLVEIPRPSSISIPGRWLQGGNSRIHINSREARDGEEGFPGTAPNHVCFAVADLPAVERALETQGLVIERAGSLAQRQVWFRLPGGSVIELQPQPSDAIPFRLPYAAP